MLCGYRPSRPPVLGSTWCCLLLRIVPQDALSAVTSVFPPMKVKVFVDDLTISHEGRYMGLPKVVGQVFNSVMKEVETKGMQLSSAENGK